MTPEQAEVRALGLAYALAEVFSETDGVAAIDRAVWRIDAALREAREEEREAVLKIAKEHTREDLAASDHLSEFGRGSYIVCKRIEAKVRARSSGGEKAP